MEVVAKEDVMRNVVVFGETGAGKSSVINMIAGEEVAKTSGDAKGCTFQSTPYTVCLDGARIKVWDTAGLNEGDKGTVAAKDAIISLYSLLKGLEDGISLLVYCVRGPRVRDTTVRNYTMFHDGLCDQKVPIVLVVTGLEQEDPMDEWWDRNRDVFLEQKMLFAGQACTTATRGKRKSGLYMFEREYEESKKKVQKLVKRHSGKPWKMQTARWLTSVIMKTANWLAGVFKVQPFVLRRTLYELLMEYGGFSAKEAKKYANDAEDEEGWSLRKVFEVFGPVFQVGS